MDAFWYSHVARQEALEESADELGPDGLSPELSPDEQWLWQSPTEHAAAFAETARQRWRFVLDDLAALPERPAIVVEGPQILPDLVPPGAAAVFLIPTPAFQRSILVTRPLPATADADQALENRIEKDRLYGEQVSRLAAAHGFPVIPVDGSRSPTGVLAEIEGLFSSILSAAPVPTRAEMRLARQWENGVVADNIWAWLGSAHVPPEAPATYAFACECGRHGCATQVELPLADYLALAQREQALGALHERVG